MFMYPCIISGYLRVIYWGHFNSEIERETSTRSRILNKSIWHQKTHHPKTDVINSDIICHFKQFQEEEFLPLLLSSWNCEVDVLCSRCGKDVEAQDSVDLGAGHGSHFLTPSVELKRGRGKTFFAQSVAMGTMAIPFPLTRLSLLLRVRTKRRDRVLVS